MESNVQAHWFRWHHGSVNDPKFRLVAKRANCSVAEVIAVWACLLEDASASPERGRIIDPDFEAIDDSMGLGEGVARRIYENMVSRGLVDEHGQVSSWHKRQPKRERNGDETSTERVRAFRQRQRQETPGNANETPGNATSSYEDQNGNTSETPWNTTERHGTHRGEERREEKEKSARPEDKPLENLTQPTNVGSPTPAGALCRKLRSAGIQAVQSMHPTLLALLDVGASEEEFLDAVPKAIGKSDPFGYLLGTVKKRREQAAEEAKGMAQGPIATPRDIAAEMAEANAERAYAASRQWAEDFRKRGEESQSPASHAARIAAMKRFRAAS